MLLTSYQPFYLTQSFCGESGKEGCLLTNVVFVIIILLFYTPMENTLFKIV